MICSKCNCELPDSSKFCVNCGASVGAPADIKRFCENCGLELPKGAKFCAVCGTPANGISADVKPLADPIAPANGISADVKPLADPIAPVNGISADVKPLADPIAPVNGISADVKPLADPIAPVNGISADVKPLSDVLSPVTLGEPVSASSEMLSVEKIEEVPETPVTEILPTDNSESGYAIPASASEFSMPAIDKTDTPAPVSNEPWGNEGQLLWQANETKATDVSEPTSLESSEMGFIPESNYSEPAAGGYSAPVSASVSAPVSAPTYTAPQANPMDNTFGNYGVNAAAVAVQPIKKKSKLKFILIPILSLIGAALIAAGVLFFVNRSLFFNIILGNSGYAAMVEGNSIKEITNKIDMGVLSNGIKSVTSMSNDAFAKNPFQSGGNFNIAPTSSTAFGAANSVVSSVDAKAMLESIKTAMSESFGANSVKVSTKLNAEITDTLKSQLAGIMHCNESDIDKFVSELNGIGFIVDFTSDEKAFEFGYEMTANGLKLNAKSIVDENGNVYLVFPFVSDKAFMVNVGTTSTSRAGQNKTVCLELEEKELKRIIEKLINTYLDVYKSCEATVESGQIKVAGATVMGKYVKVNFTGKKMAELAKKICDAIADDSYLCGKIATFMLDCGTLVNEDYIKNSIKSTSEMWERVIPETSGLVIETITDNSCKVLGKSYTSIFNNKEDGKISFAGDFNASTKNGTIAAFEVKTAGKTDFTVYLDKKSDTEGSCNIAVYVKGKMYSVTVNYSDVKESTFCGKKINEGRVEVGIDVPADFTTGGANFGEISAALNSAKVIVSIKTDGDAKLDGEFAVDVPQYGKISLKFEVSAENKSETISVPSDVVDFTNIGKSINDIPEETKNKIIAYLKDMKTAISNQNAGDIGNAIASGLDSIIGSAEKGSAADREEINKFYKDVIELKNDVKNLDERYNNVDQSVVERANELANEITNLYERATMKGYKMSEDELNAFRTEYLGYKEIKEALEKELAKALGTNVGFGTKAADVDFTGLDFDSLTAVLVEYISRFNIAAESANSYIGSNKAEVTALVDDAEEKCEAVTEDYNNLYGLYEAGTLNLSYLRKTRKSAKEFAYAVEALENSLHTTV